MSKNSKPGLLRRRVERVWDKLTGSPVSTPLTSQTFPSTLVHAVTSPATSSTFHGSLQAPPQPSLLLAPPASVITPTTTMLLTPPAIPLTPHSLTSSSSASVMWTGLGIALRALHVNSTVFPPLQSAIGGLLSCVESFENSKRNRKEYESLALELKTLSETLDRHLQGSQTFPMLEFVVKTVQLIQGQVDIISKIERYESTRRAIEAEAVKEALSACDHHIQVLSRQLQIDTDLRAANEQEFKRQDTLLEYMKPAKLATFNSHLATKVNRRTCTKHTRTGVLSTLDTWSTNLDAPNVCWMNGMAGTGKTTIACTFASELKKRELLAASFFCTRTTEECRDVNRIVPTIAYQLARFSAPFRSALCRVLVSDSDLAYTMPSTQFERLLKEPLLATKVAIPRGLVVVIDALDECSADNGLQLIVDTLLHAAPNLPIKFFVASRPDPTIWNLIQLQPEDWRTVLVLHNVPRLDVQADIELYLREELPSITQLQVKQLASLAGGLFIYAATVIRYIQGGSVTGEFDKCLERMLSVESSLNEIHTDIDNLYRAILSTADGILMKKEYQDQMRHVMWMVVCACEPVSVEALAVLAGLDSSKKALAMLHPLRSVLFISDDNKAVSVLHASFPDFIFNSTRSANFFCNVGQYHQLVAKQCFMVMKAQLRFNICGLEASYVTDEAVPDLSERVDQNISPTLGYACRYWANHIQETSDSEAIYILLRSFLSEELLFWMEVMNLKQWMGIGVHAISAAKRWLNKYYPGSELLRVVEDSRNFVTSFAANAVSRSTPHIYTSALALCHRSSTVYKNFWARTCGLIEPKGPCIDRREFTILASWKVNSIVNSVAYSPDGTRLAIGCDGGSVLIKSAHDRIPVDTPLMGHADDVVSVAFSPDGTHIVSGSRDHTIRVWENLSGTPVSTSFAGHSGSVNSVAFSPDSTRIVSGSQDCTVCLWDVRNGALVHAPFEGHTDRVTSVAFSPNGRTVVSGSYDETVRVWSVQDGTLVWAPFEGHTDIITSAVFSPSGKYVASGSWDKTVRIWDMDDGGLVGTPLTGHSDWVTSVAFSPDDTHVISGSWDCTIRVWSVQSGGPIGIPFECHTGQVISVAVSPDGTRVASGSEDCTVRVWNVQDSDLSQDDIVGHTSVFTHLALSPDGALLASGSESGTVCTFDMHDGTLFGPPLEGHTNRIRSVAFLPDGKKVVSCSEDHTFRIWGIQDGSFIANTLGGQVERILSVAFSYDGTRMATGSGDRAIRIWNIKDGKCIGEPLWGHSKPVLSVTFSPDGVCVASGSTDKTIRVWNIEDNTIVCPPFEGHIGSVISVAFSPDGTIVASGSNDCTIRLWSIHEGTPVGEPFKGHASPVVSVAFSFDGTRIVSGSADCVIHVWDVRSNALAGVSFQGHTSAIRSVVFSPDSAYIVSSSKDSIRVWNLGKIGPKIDTWTVAEDGWVRDCDSRLLLWLPEDLIPIFPNPQNPWIVGPRGLISFDHRKLVSDDYWKGCSLKK